MTNKIWTACHDLEEFLPCFQNISTDITRIPVNLKLGRLEIDLNPSRWEGYAADDTETKETNQESSETESSVAFIPWDERLTEFQKLCIIKSFKEEKVCLNFPHCITKAFFKHTPVGCVCGNRFCF